MITENIERSGLTNIHAVQKDATVCDADIKDAADLVIADLPCSGLGVLAKKTDLKYKATEQGTKELAGLQEGDSEKCCVLCQAGRNADLQHLYDQSGRKYRKCTLVFKRISGICTGSDRGQTVQHSSE